MPKETEGVSVTRHLDLTENKIWGIAQGIADQTKRTLKGRGDILASGPRAQRLDVVADYTNPDNPNHATIVGWPANKEAKIGKAISIAKLAKLVLPPN